MKLLTRYKNNTFRFDSAMPHNEMNIPRKFSQVYPSGSRLRGFIFNETQFQESFQVNGDVLLPYPNIPTEFPDYSLKHSWENF